MLNEQFNRIMIIGLAEGRRLLWIFLYLWILLGLFAVHKSIVLHEPNLFYHQGLAFINAWLLAKIILAAEMMGIADNLGHKPLIYPIVFKSATYSIILISFYLLEEVTLGVWHGKTVVQSIPAFGGGSVNGILIVGIIMFVVLMPFFSLREIGRDIGGDELYKLFFIRRMKFVPQHSQSSSL